jgi:hypothetical protein
MAKAFQRQNPLIAQALAESCSILLIQLANKKTAQKI